MDNFFCLVFFFNTKKIFFAVQKKFSPVKKYSTVKKFTPAKKLDTTKKINVLAAPPYSDLPCLGVLF